MHHEKDAAIYESISECAGWLKAVEHTLTIAGKNDTIQRYGITTLNNGRLATDLTNVVED